MMPRHFRPIALLTLAAALVPAAPAAAAPTERIVVERFVEPYEFTIDCSEFGPYAFENLVSGIQRIRVVDVVAADGTLLRTEFNIAIREVDENSVTGATLPLRTAVREVWHYATGTRTLNGAVFIGTDAGAGTYVHDSGRITMTLDTRIASFLAGPKEAYLSGGVDYPVCAALAAA